jgi:hypothetical protein
METWMLFIVAYYVMYAIPPYGTLFPWKCYPGFKGGLILLYKEILY